MERRLEEFATKVLGGSSPDEAWEYTTDYFGTFGFRGAVYGQRYLDRTPTERDIAFTTGLSAWKAEYFRNKDYERDPLFVYAPKLPDTFFTGLAFLSRYPYLQPEDIAIIERANSFGLTTGFAIKLAGGESGVVRGWNLVSAFSAEEIISLDSEFGSHLQICAAIADQKISQITMAADVVLTAREKECLCWLAEGHRREMIGEFMSIRPVTVDLHMRSARRKLGARTREQALAIALRAGLLPV